MEPHYVICLSICLSVCLSVCLFVCLSSFVDPCLHLSLCPSGSCLCISLSPLSSPPTHLEDGVVWVLDGQPVEHGQGDIGDDWLLQGDSRDATTDGGRGRDWRAHMNTSVEGGREGGDKIRHSRIVD